MYMGALGRDAMAAENDDWNEGEQSSPPTDDGPPAETEQTEIQEVRVDDQEIAERMDEAEVFGTYTKRIGSYKLQIGPVFSNSGTYWVLSIYKEGVTGALYDSSEPLTDNDAGWLGIESNVQEAANDALEFANQNLIPSRKYRSQQRPSRSFSELEEMMEEEDA